MCVYMYVCLYTCVYDVVYWKFVTHFLIFAVIQKNIKREGIFCFKYWTVRNFFIDGWTDGMGGENYRNMYLCVYAVHVYCK